MSPQSLYARGQASTKGPETPSKDEQDFGDWLNTLKLKPITIKLINNYAGKLDITQRKLYEQRLEAAFRKIAELIGDPNFESARRVDTASIADPHDPNKEVKVVGVTVLGDVIEVMIDRAGKRTIRFTPSYGSGYDANLEGIINDTLRVGMDQNYIIRPASAEAQTMDMPIEIIALARTETQYMQGATPLATPKAKPGEGQQGAFGFEALHAKRKAQT